MAQPLLNFFLCDRASTLRPTFRVSFVSFVPLLFPYQLNANHTTRQGCCCCSWCCRAVNHTVIIGLILSQDILWRDGAIMGWVAHPITCGPKQSLPPCTPSPKT
ncbi:hypothetical protein PFLUV_G00056760 [Perca fluviatilis]|uniref:Uncharacterized protein n=1 Tax=Perca fluviatilis TaxID=8168 RepID=A0A6A5FM63_PERFL|nr:hypothetical protein PFLUV_G00056760 [Perca fluviatilis]